ncbi:MAG: hydroxyacid dehydrogenase [Holophaga sp.]|jgi:D-3-phosphoglycerate dehydrogenase
MSASSPRFRILLFEPIHEAGLRLLEEHGEVILAPSLDEAALLEAARDVDAVIIRNYGRVGRDLIQAAPRLKVIGRHGSGLDTIDFQAAAERGIRVVYTPEANCESVAEHFVAMALILSKRMLEADRALRAGEWGVRYKYFGREMRGKTLGVVGFGRVGRATAQICHHGFGMPVLYHNRTRLPLEEEARYGARPAGLEELLAQADYVSLNLPLTPETRHCIGREQIRKMKPTAYLINLGRGPLWDEAAVLEALERGWIAGAGTDVYEREPAGADHPLFRHGRFVCTPHMSAHTDEAMRRMSLVAEDVIAVLEGREPRWPAPVG